VEAEALAPQLEDRWHFRPMLHARIGLVRMQLGEEEAAARAFAEAVRVAEANKDAYVGAVGLASVLRHQARIGADPAPTLAAFERQLAPETQWSETEAIDAFDRLRLLIEAAAGATRDRNEHVARRALSLARRTADRPAVSGGDGGARLSLEALCLIADAYLELPDEASAQRLLESARKLAPRAGSGIEPRRPLIESLARLGREEDALALAREVDAEEEGLAAVGAMRAERGDEAGALEVARAISDPPLQQRVQTALAIFYAKQSRWEDAYATAGRGFPAIALSQILREQARSGVPDGVARTLALVQGPEEDKAWSLLRRTYLGVYDLAGVDAAPGGMQSVERARLLLHDGRREEALAIAEGWRRTRDPMRAFDLAELALEAARLFDPVEYDPFGVDD
jgi:tetratricopeptide (TPR) repeat protein